MRWSLEFAKDMKFPVLRIGEKNIVDSKLLIVATRSNENLVLLNRCLGKDLRAAFESNSAKTVDTEIVHLLQRSNYSGFQQSF